VVLSAAEVNTLAALKSRQASTLLPELRKPGHANRSDSARSKKQNGSTSVAIDTDSD
jgi:hypothetical protein